MIYSYYCNCSWMVRSFRCSVLSTASWQRSCTTKPHLTHLRVTQLLTVHGEHAQHLRLVLQAVFRCRQKLLQQRLLRGWLKGSRPVDGYRCPSLQMAHRCHCTVSRSTYPPTVKLSTPISCHCLSGFWQLRQNVPVLSHKHFELPSWTSGQ